MGWPSRTPSEWWFPTQSGQVPATDRVPLPMTLVRPDAGPWRPPGLPPPSVASASGGAPNGLRERLPVRPGGHGRDVYDLTGSQGGRVTGGWIRDLTRQI
jgi:hypothetical protein